jgi:hypothetical protein
MPKLSRLLAIIGIGWALAGPALADERPAVAPLPAEARAAVRDYASDGGKVGYRGISATQIDTATYFAVVDFGDNKDLMLVLVRYFVDDGGHGYWKASAIDPTTAALFGDRLRPQ